MFVKFGFSYKINLYNTHTIDYVTHYLKQKIDYNIMSRKLKIVYFITFKLPIDGSLKLIFKSGSYNLIFCKYLLF